MSLVLACATRLLKNAKFLQSPEVGYLPKEEPLDGYCSLIPDEVLSQLHLLSPKDVGIDRLTALMSLHTPPRASARLVAPLFSGALNFVQTTFSTGGVNFMIPDPDMEAATKYAGLVALPISEYASQYGPNRLSVEGGTTQFKASVPGGKYNDSLLSGWADQLAKERGLGPNTCLVFLNPQGVVNTDADATQGVLGYHSHSSMVPYAFVNVLGQGLTVDDIQDAYAVALSHEIAEMTVDPKADGSNPEVCDPCAGNCGVDHRNYFDSNGTWLGGTATTGYGFMIDGIAKPTSVTQCPAPTNSCSYPPPKAGG